MFKKKFTFKQAMIIWIGFIAVTVMIGIILTK